MNAPETSLSSAGFFSSKLEGPLPNQGFLATILIAQRTGQGCLPYTLGLRDDDYQTLLGTYFSAIRGMIDSPGNFREQHAIRQELLELRNQEFEELTELLVQNARGVHFSEAWLAQIIAAGCMGGDHLWRDLGLVNRESLKALFVENFPGLAEKNSADMRWKKFLYRQLCETGGHFVCRSPSCETCPTYDECFGEEV
ncbi:nitrogen fixation protein NifQ [Teredinibacter turnerae]|uniref:nitrogen fixation protein NifQ n=1 Tax=Teredinibacter turnerae TaxID=2426 RepID=UPI0004172BEE|nr:nitrogen fixation protein NifQ [Teredinibacter turnerae]